MFLQLKPPSVMPENNTSEKAPQVLMTLKCKFEICFNFGLNTELSKPSAFSFHSALLFCVLFLTLDNFSSVAFYRNYFLCDRQFKTTVTPCAK